MFIATISTDPRRSSASAEKCASTDSLDRPSSTESARLPSSSVTTVTYSCRSQNVVSSGAIRLTEASALGSSPRSTTRHDPV